MRTSVIKQWLRSILGDGLASWVHALRMAWLAIARRRVEIDKLIVPHIVRAGDTVIDVGANGADWTLVLSRQVGPAGRVFAFEADPYYAEVTRKTIWLLGLRNVTLFPFGLADRPAEAFLQIIDDENRRLSGTSRLVPDSAPAKPGQLARVRLDTLDSLAQSHHEIRKTRLLKCDVEGFELMVARGALQVIRTARPIVVTEVGWAHLHGYTDSELFDFFTALDYDCFVVVSERTLRRSNQAGDIREGHRPNRVMIPRELSPTLDLFRIG